MTERVYLDWNATTPLGAAARAAMIAAMDVTGNASSVHTEGRGVKRIIETARAQVAGAIGSRVQDVVFTSGATEAAALACAGHVWHCGAVEHDAVAAWCVADVPVDGQGRVSVADPQGSAVQLANSETGVVQEVPAGVALCDATQAFGKLAFSHSWLGAERVLVSAHKLGGPKGAGALVLREGLDVEAAIKGGGQEMGRRSGTENVIGIAGFGAAAEAAATALADGVWDAVEENRNWLEARLAEAAPDTIFVGKGAARLPNTLCAITRGWKGETQVMQMDLAGFAVSAGSACSSGKVRASKVLRAMGFDEEAAASAIRVSIGPETTRAQLERFADSWLAARARWSDRRKTDEKQAVSL